MAHRIHFEDIRSYLGKNLLLKKTVQEVFKNLQNNYSEFKKVTDQDLISLNSVFREVFEKALEIVEEKKVTYFHTKSDDCGLYQVEGSSCRTYTIYPYINYCSCPSYKYQVSRGSYFMCKHVLATVISNVIENKQSIEVTDEHFKDLILESNLKTSQSMKKMDSRITEDWQNENSYLYQHVHPPPAIQPPMLNTYPSNWAQVPPQTMPWGLPAMSQPPVIRFTAGNFNVSSTSIKRKSDSLDNMVPAKILATEEKMAAHLRSLHISDVEVDPQEVATNLTCKDESMETERLPKLVISNEIKNFKTEPIIPESILKRLEKPEMALVLWQPPPADLSSRLKELKKLSKTKGKENVNGNEESVEDSEMEVENREEKTMDVVMEGEMDNSNHNTIFKPANLVSMSSVPPQYFQPLSQCQEFTFFNGSSTPY